MAGGRWQVAGIRWQVAGGRWQISDVRWGGGVGTVEFLLKFMTAPDNIRTYANKLG